MIALSMYRKSSARFCGRTIVDLFLAPENPYLLVLLNDPICHPAPSNTDGTLLLPMDLEQLENEGFSEDSVFQDRRQKFLHLGAHQVDNSVDNAFRFDRHSL